MNIYVVTSECPRREYVFPISDKAAAIGLLTVMNRGSYTASMVMVKAQVIVAKLAAGLCVTPTGWDRVLAAQRAL